MPVSKGLPLHYLSLGLVMIAGVVNAADIGRRDISYSRQVIFELTYRNRDLIWLGDPASPTASVYLRRNAHPIATDLCVSTLVKDNVSPSRRYFHEARLTTQNGVRTVYAFTSSREKRIGTIDEKKRFSPNAFYKHNPGLLPSWPTNASSLAYDDQKNMLFFDIDIPGPLISESLDFLPLELSNIDDTPVRGQFSLDYALSGDGSDIAKPAVVSLTLKCVGISVRLAEAAVPTVFRGESVQIGSFNNETGTYVTEAAYRAGAASIDTSEPSVTFTLPGKFCSSLRSEEASLVLVDTPVQSQKEATSLERIVIDGNFDDWRNVIGVDDPRGDVVPYLEYIPDVDLLEYKVSHDDQHIYLYARVAGKVGRCDPVSGRSYFYAYMDVDRDPETGFLPSRDDDCYFGVDMGDDCEVQFEFVNNVLRKTFYGFCGIGGNDNVLKQEVSLGKSQYGRFDTNGVERASYKSEYIFHGGVTSITEDLKLGTSDTIQLAISPDGSEVEVSSSFKGFLKNLKGQPTVQIGQTIDLALGMECDSKAYYDKTRWAADSTRPLRGYELVPSKYRNLQTDDPEN